MTFNLIISRGYICEEGDRIYVAHTVISRDLEAVYRTLDEVREKSDKDLHVLTIRLR